MDYEDVLTTIREEIQAEHSLISQRLSWYVGAQSFLLTAYAIAWNQHHEWRPFFQHGMPILGALLSVMALIGVWCALEVQKDLIKHQEELLKTLRTSLKLKDPEAEKVLAEYDKTTCSGRHSGKRFHDLAMTPPWVVPILFLVVWVVAYVGKLNA